MISATTNVRGGLELLNLRVIELRIMNLRVSTIAS
jgi:hypothetical protein